MKRHVSNPVGSDSHGVLIAFGIRIKGARLRCGRCGEELLVGTPEAAQVLGWSRVRNLCGTTFEGLCIECTSDGARLAPWS